MEQIEALLKRINAENKKTKEVLDNIQKGELNGNVKRKNSGKFQKDLNNNSPNSGYRLHSK